MDKPHICEVKLDHLAKAKAKAENKPVAATTDYADIVNNPATEVVHISTTPEQTHYPIAGDCLKAGKHVLLEKPMALDLWDADELVALSH